MRSFVPKVFESIVELCSPNLLHKEAFNLEQKVSDLCRVCDYWSLQGAALHVKSAFEIALADAPLTVHSLTPSK
ncbi:MAG: hypothetical protein ACJ0DG_09135 [bacterium]